VDTPRLTSLGQMVQAVKARGRPPRVAIAPCAEEFVLRAALHAAKEGLAEPIFLGDIAGSRAVAGRLGLDLGAFEFAPPPLPECMADANEDGVTDAADLSVLLGQFEASVTPGSGADFNGDGSVDGADLSVLLGGFGCGTN